MNRIHKVFKQSHGDILSIFYTAGFPRLDDTISIAKSLQDAGADMIEIGIPFSDPVADGPTIQYANKVALENGMNVRLLLQQVKEIRKDVSIPIILMGYLNPVLQYGIERFIHDAAKAGVDGLILPDMPADVYQHEFKDMFEKAGLTNTFLISPTTSDDRIQRIDSLTNGFIYAVAASSITGAREGFSEDQVAYFKKLKNMHLKNQFLIGFGISNNDTFRTASSYGAGAIIGSAFITLIKDNPDPRSIAKFIKNIKGASIPA